MFVLRVGAIADLRVWSDRGPNLPLESASLAKKRAILDAILPIPTGNGSLDTREGFDIGSCAASDEAGIRDLLLCRLKGELAQTDGLPNSNG